MVLLNLFLLIGLLVLSIWNVIFGWMLSLLFNQIGVKKTFEEMKEDLSTLNKIVLFLISIISFPAVFFALLTNQSVESLEFVYEKIKMVKNKTKKYFKIY